MAQSIYAQRIDALLSKGSFTSDEVPTRLFNSPKVVGHIDLSKFDKPTVNVSTMLPKGSSVCTLCGQVKYTSECRCEIDY